MGSPGDPKPRHRPTTRPSAKPWTLDQERTLLERYRAGVLLREIGAELDRDTGTIGTHLEILRQRGEDLQVRKPRWTDDERKRLARRYREGATRPQLCNEFGRARGTIGRQLAWMRAHGYDLDRNPQHL